MTAQKTSGNPFGLHRVLSPKGRLPQPARKLDNRMDIIWDTELLIDVEMLLPWSAVMPTRNRLLPNPNRAAAPLFPWRKVNCARAAWPHITSNIVASIRRVNIGSSLHRVS